MPSEAFNKLSEEKKQRILAAAIEEFSTHPLMKATSTNVIRNSGISRGSFYQYFDNIQSVYHYTINQLWKKYRQDLIASLKRHDHDLYQGLVDFSEFYLNDLISLNYMNIVKNLVSHLTYLIHEENDARQSEKDLFGLFDTGVAVEENSIFEVIDLDSYAFHDKYEALEFIHYTIALLHEVILYGFLQKLSQEEIINLYCQRLNWLFKGISRS